PDARMVSIRPSPTINLDTGSSSTLHPDPSPASTPVSPRSHPDALRLRRSPPPDPSDNDRDSNRGLHYDSPGKRIAGENRDVQARAEERLSSHSYECRSQLWRHSLRRGHYRDSLRMGWIRTLALQCHTMEGLPCN